MSDLLCFWFTLWGLLWLLYFCLDGADLGLCALLPWLARSETERRAVYKVAGPFRDGNEAWLLLALGLLFTVFPKAFSVLASAFALPFLLLLLALVLRAVALELRNLAASPRPRAWCDACICAASFAVALLLGLLFANLLQGLPLNPAATGSASWAEPARLLRLFNPYALCSGALFVLMFAQHGLILLSRRSQGPLRYRAQIWQRVLWLFLFGLLLLWLAAGGAFTGVYASLGQNPALAALPLTALLALVTARFAPAGSRTAWLASALFMAGLVFFGLAGIYPALPPSSSDPAFSLNIASAAAAPRALKVMLAPIGLLIPLIIAAQFAARRILSQRGSAPGAAPGQADSSNPNDNQSV